MNKRVLSLIIAAMSISTFGSLSVNGKENKSETFQYVAQASTKVTLPSKGEEILSENGVSINEEWIIQIPKEIKKESIAGVIIKKDFEFVPVTVNITSQNEIKVRPTNAYVGNSKYCLNIFLNDGTQYFMNFTTKTESRKADVEPNDNYGKANLITGGETIVGSLDGTNDKEDWYQVNISEDGTLKLDLTNKNGSRVNLYIYGKDGGNSYSIAEDAAYDKSVRHLVKGLAAGTYYIKITGDDANYELKTEFIKDTKTNDKLQNDLYGHAQEINVNSNNTGHIGHYGEDAIKDSTDWYKVVLDKDGILNLDVNHNKDERIDLYLYGKDGINSNSIAEDAAYDKSIRQISKGLTAGTYYIKVFSENSGEYDFKTKLTIDDKTNDKEDNDKYINALEFKLNTDITGHIGYVYDSTGQDKDDLYKIVLSKSGTLDLELSHYNGNRINFYLYGENGTNDSSIVEDSAYDKDKRFISKQLSAGTYYIKVNSDNAGAYKLSNIFR